MARILVDADACPVVAGVEEMAEKYDLPCKLFCDTKDENIDLLLMERHMAKKARREKNRHHLKGPAKRTKEDDERFKISLEKLILQKIFCKDSKDNC